MTESSTYDSIGNMLMKGGENYAYTRNNPVKYVDRDGKKTEVWIKHANPNNYFDAGHAMINVDGDFYDFYPSGSSVAKLLSGKDVSSGLGKNNLGTIMEMYHQRESEGAVFTLYDLDISKETESQIQEHLEYWNSHQENLPKYELYDNNCAQYIITELLNKFAGFNLETDGYLFPVTPENLADQLYKNKKVNQIQGGFESNNRYIQIESPEKKTIFKDFLKKIRENRDQTKQESQQLSSQRKV